jgi:hypothetical protein
MSISISDRMVGALSENLPPSTAVTAATTCLMQLSRILWHYFAVLRGECSHKKQSEPVFF